MVYFFPLTNIFLVTIPSDAVTLIINSSSIDAKLEFLLFIDNSTTSSIGTVLSRRTVLPSFVLDITVLDP